MLKIQRVDTGTLMSYTISLRRQKIKAETCYCDGWPFPHRIRCKNCIHEDPITKALRDMILYSTGPSKEPPF